MADPLTGLATVAVVSSILQVIDFSAKCVSETRKLIRSSEDALKENVVVETLAREYETLSDRLTSFNNASRPLTLEEQAVDNLAQECKKEARALLTLLDDLKVKDLSGAKRVFKAGVQATRSVRARKSIEARQKYLAELNGQLSTSLVQIFRSTHLEGFEDTLGAIQEAKVQNAQIILDCKQAILQAIKGFGRQHGTIVTQQFEEGKVWLDARLAVQDEMKVDEMIIDSLRFKEMHQRRHAIDIAHRATFKWVFRDSSSAFRQWLGSDDGLFWISGKAGSGKSTLMKYISTRPRTKEILATWSGTSRLVVVDAYLWNPGSALQRTESGLLQGILYQMLSACRDLVEIATPRRYQESTMFHKRPDPWSEPELREALENIIQDDTNDTHFCFFIDGLDEYYGDYTRLIETLKYLGQQPRIKMCLSSRPWNVFRNAFQHLDASLCVEDLTQQDIRQYTNDMLGPVTLGRPEAGKLIDQIVDKAKGVFLWVFLVVRSLRQGMEEGDSLRILRQRVSEFPEDLEDYFRLILSRVSSTYRRLTAQTLKVAMLTLGNGTKQSIHGGCSFLSFWLVCRGLDNSDFAFETHWRPMSTTELQAMAIETRDFINACCKDFLHMPSLSRATLLTDPVAYDVEFLHRTVYDFFDGPDMKHILDDRAPTHFKCGMFPAHLALARSKMLPYDKPYLCEYITSVAASAISNADGDSEATLRLVSDFEELLLKSLKGGCPDECTFHKPRMFRRDALREVIEYLLAFHYHTFIKTLIDRDPSLIASMETSEWSTLLPALGVSPRKPFPASSIDIGVVQMLEQKGARLSAECLASQQANSREAATRLQRIHDRMSAEMENSAGAAIDVDIPFRYRGI